MLLNLGTKYLSGTLCGLEKVINFKLGGQRIKITAFFKIDFFVLFNDRYLVIKK